MSQLQDIVIAAHGDIERWCTYDRLSADVVIGGAQWEVKDQADLIGRLTAKIELHRQFACLVPFGGAGLRGIFTPEHVSLTDAEGDVLAERLQPRAAFDGHTRETPWDRLHAAFFVGSALWNYLTEPFAFSRPGFEFAELEPWDEDGETWRRLRVTFPDDVVTHSRVQTFYVDADGLIRRHDYHPDVLGPSDRVVAHYSSEHEQLDGFLIPTRRTVHRTDDQGRKVPEPVLISIDVIGVGFY
jgi:hypothetical protein